MVMLYTNKGRDCHSVPDANYPCTAQGEARQASTLAACSTAASLVDGDLTWTAPAAGAWGNNVRIIHEQGVSGPVSRPLAIVADLNAETVTVTWGTDGGGTPVAPTPAEVVAEAAGNDDLALLATPSSGGATPCSIINQKMAGGLDDGDWLRVSGVPGLRVINTKV